MTQFIDIKYNDDVKSRPINERFLDITKSTVLKGFHILKGDGPFDLTLSRGHSKESAAITPSGAKVTETEDLDNVIQITPNDTEAERVDAIYLKYEYGRRDSVATYVTVSADKEENVINPNPSTHLLLGWINVPPRKAPLNENSFRSVPKGIRIPNMVGDTVFDGNFIFKGDITIEGEINGSIGTDIQGTFIEKMLSPIKVERKDQTFTTHKPYIMGSNSLFVYLNGELLLPNDVLEMSPTTFKITKDLEVGDTVWAFWFLKIQLIKNEDHDHDDRYYTKDEINNRMVIYLKGNFKGMSGDILEHNLNGLDYSVIGVTPVSKTTDVGYISVSKESERVVVYNSGSYRGPYDIGLILNNDSDVFPHGIGNVYKVVADTPETATSVYRSVKRYRKNMTLHSESVLTQKNAKGLYSNLEIKFYDFQGKDVVNRRNYRLVYDSKGTLISSERID